MTIFTRLVGALAMLAGIGWMFTAVTYPGSFSLRTASAVQVTQVYSEATYYGVLAIVAFSFAILVELAGRRQAPEVDSERIEKLLEYIAKTSHEQTGVLRQVGSAVYNQQSDPRYQQSQYQSYTPNVPSPPVR